MFYVVIYRINNKCHTNCWRRIKQLTRKITFIKIGWKISILHVKREHLLLHLLFLWFFSDRKKPNLNEHSCQIWPSIFREEDWNVLRVQSKTTTTEARVKHNASVDLFSPVYATSNTSVKHYTHTAWSMQHVCKIITSN
jgi:hypothetical protein